MSRVFWDTNLFIYLFEDYADLSGRVAALRERMLTRGDQLCTSTLTVGELLSGAARIYAALRAADTTIRPPDAIQLACAAEAKVDMFITNDDRLSQKVVPGVQFVVPLDRAFL